MTTPRLLNRCERFHQNPTINPDSGRTIKAGANTYQQLVRDCGPPPPFQTFQPPIQPFQPFPPFQVPFQPPIQPFQPPIQPFQPPIQPFINSFIIIFF